MQGASDPNWIPRKLSLTVARQSGQKPSFGMRGGEMDAHDRGDAREAMAGGGEQMSLGCIPARGVLTARHRHDANVEAPATTPRPPGPRPPLGATNVQRFVQALGPQGLGLRLAGLCDIAELRHVRRGLERAGVTTGEGTEDHGFYPCDADLEDELIRALGTAAVERVLDAEGELVSFRRFQDQPAQRGRDLHAQLCRFLGTRAGRKVRYGTLLVDALSSTACRMCSTSRWPTCTAEGFARREGLPKNDK